MIIIKNIKGIIFDLDGIITDTADYHYQSWRKMTNEENIKFNRKINEKLRGLTREKSLKVILNGKEISKTKKEELLKRKNEYYHEFIANMDETDLIPGIQDILYSLKNKEYKMSIASSSKNARPIINKLGFSDLFEVIADGNSVAKNKPAPDLFLYTADKMNLKPEHCLVIEDSQAGVQAALKANMSVVGIGPEKRIGEADFCYTQVKNINLKQILS